MAPASVHTIDNDGYLIDSKPWFKWYYKPKKQTLQEATDSFQHLFEKIVSEQAAHKNIILPLSGGLDSRSHSRCFKEDRSEGIIL